jgi:hypothetical protein
MANQLSVNPIVLDTDLPSYQAAQTLTASVEPLGLRIRKMALFGNGTTVAGTVSVTDPVSGRLLLVPMIIPAGGSLDTALFEDDYPSAPPMWTDFKVTGLTSTVTKLVLWVSL